LSDRPGERVPKPGAAFLLSQLGGHSSRRWTERLAVIDLEPREVMLFRHVALAEGRSQGDLARAIGLPASRIVGLVDRLEARGWIERRTSSADRRTRSLFLTATGRTVLDRIATVSAEHEADLTQGLDPTDRKRLIKLLRRMAAEHGLIEGVHPGFADPNADQSRGTER
jgi:DNA-binding MarR family transcriptional regulator